jgi:hypothetical protein
VSDAQLTPRRGGHQVGSTQAGWEVGDAERPGDACDGEAGRQLASVAQRALEELPDPLAAGGPLENPRALREGGIMPHMLRVQALEVCHPVAALVLVEP